MNKAEQYGIPFIYESNLSSNLFQREALYCAGNTEIKAFINNIQAAGEQLRQNANPRLVLEELMLNIPGRKHG